MLHLFAHNCGHELLFILFDAWMCVFVYQVRLSRLHSNLLQMIIECLVAVALDDIKLVRVPQLREDLLDVMLVHAKVHEVHLGTRLTEEGAISDVSMSRLPLVAINAVCVELIVGDEGDH